MHPFLAVVAAAAISAQAGQTAPPQPQPPATTVVGADGKLVSLIFLRADAENVTRRVYDALLDRQPNEQEFAESVAELQRGRLPQQLAAIVQTAEFTDRAASLPAAQMLDQVFQGLLNRRPTPAEAKTYLPQLQSRQYPPALLKLITSDSFRKQVALDRAAAPTSPAPAAAAPVAAPASPPKPATPERTLPMPSPSATSAPPGTPVPMPSPVSPVTPPPPSLPAARAPLRPAPFPTARNAGVSTPLVASPALSSEWTRILACQDLVVGQFRTDPASKILIRFDAAEISASSVRGTAVDVLDGNRRLSYQCIGGRATSAYLDARPQRPAAAGTVFPVEEIRACHAAVTVALSRDRRDAAPTFVTAGVMPTDGNLFIRGRGADRAQPFTYQCQWDGSGIVGATFTLVSR